MELLELIPQKVGSKHEGDGPKHAFPLCSWVYHMKLTIIESVLSVGFELEIYQLYEYVLIYGYFLVRAELMKVPGAFLLDAQSTTRANEILYPEAKERFIY